MLFVSAYDVIPEPTRTIVMVLQSILAIGCILIGAIALSYTKKSGKELSKSYFLGISIFFVLVGLARAVLVYHDFFASDEFDILLWKIANIIVLTGFTFLSYTIETHVYKKTKHAFTLIGAVITGAFALIWDKSIATIIMYIGTVLLILLPLIIYIITAKKSVGEIRKRAMIIIVGIFILLVAQGTGLFEMIGIMDKVVASIFGPPTALLGLTICGYGFISMAR